ncbi:paraquat-inducible protein A [Salmonella bongori]|nr:paraquat-inducible protein A [Salmonella bongori]
MFSEDYASLGTFFLLFVQLVPAFCLVTILLLVNRADLPLPVKKMLARIFFLLKSWGMAEIFLAGVLVSFVKLMAYGDIGIGSSFYSLVLILYRTATGVSVCRSPLVVG